MQWLLAIVSGYVIYRLRERIDKELRAALERFNDKEERELQAWVRGVKRMEAARSGAPAAAEPDAQDWAETARWHQAKAVRLRGELAQLYERASWRSSFPFSRRRRRTRGSVPKQAP